MIYHGYDEKGSTSSGKYGLLHLLHYDGLLPVRQLMQPAGSAGRFVSRTLLFLFYFLVRLFLILPFTLYLNWHHMISFQVRMV